MLKKKMHTIIALEVTLKEQEKSVTTIIIIK